MKVLIVDDHSLMVDSYKQVLSVSFNHLIIKAETNFSAAHTTLETEQFDIVLLDWIFADHQPDPGGKTLFDLARKNNSDVKIIIITSLADAVSLYEMSRVRKANAVLVKSDISNNELFEAIRNVLNGTTYFSSTVLEGIKRISNESFYIDNFNRNILTLLSKGVRSKNLVNYIPLSMSAIDKRKAGLRDIFSLKVKCGDEELVAEARKRKII